MCVGVYIGDVGSCGCKGRIIYQSLIGSVWHIVAWGAKMSEGCWVLSDDEAGEVRVMAIAWSVLAEVGDGVV
jgi:hypothetical protein